MRPTTPLRLFAARTLSALLAVSMTFGPVSLAYGAATPLADVPIAAKVSAKPNIIYTLDDSGSMQYNFLPDYVTNAGATVNVSLTRQGPIAGDYRARTNGVGALSSLAVGDWVNVIGAAQPEYNGFFQIVNKPSGNQIEYVVGPVASSPITVAPGYGNIQIVTSAAYCRSGNGTSTCPQQAVAINAVGSVIGGNTLTRPGPIGTGGTVTVTATNSVANYANINTGDSVLITNSSTGQTTPGSTSDPYYGEFIVTKTSPTTFTYQITAVAGVTPLSAGGNRYVAVQNSTSFAPPPLHAADFNRMAYNPAVTYTAPKKGDGTPLTNTGTDVNGNYGGSNWNSPSVDRDPFSAYETAAGVSPMWPATVKDDLSIKVGVPLYCNTDWPTLVNEPDGPATARDAGDQNGQYLSGSGAWCRINGTAYDAAASSGAPAAVADYNYPWQPSVGGTVGPEYFYRLLSRKVLWCDTTSPYYPKSGTIVSCNGGTANYSGSPRQQRCNKNGDRCNPVAGSRNYTPAACATDPPAMYCLPGIGGSDSYSLGTGTLPECLPCTCNKDTPPATPGSCSITGATCDNNFGVLGGNPGQCPDQPPITITSCTGGNPVYQNDSGACGKFLFDPYTNAPLVPATTMLDDANGDGVVCRHNNLTYTVMGAPAVGGLATYARTNIGDVAPANKTGGTTPMGYALNQLGKFTQQVTSGCPVVGQTVQIPRHYYVIDTVTFCADKDVTPNGQWRGFGSASCAPDQENDLASHQQVKYGQFTRIDLFPQNSVPFPGNSKFAASATPYPKGDLDNPSSREWLAAVNPGPDNSESINYANWYAYYSTRLNAGKSASATAFSYLTNVAPDPIQYRVGFHNLGEEPVGYGGAGTPIIWLDVADWDLTQRNLWYGKLFGISVSNYKTPTLDAMLRIGNLVETGGASGLPAYINPLPASAQDPFDKKVSDGTLVSCQNNYHILFTDGKTNQVSAIAVPGDQDATVPSTLSLGPGEPIQKMDDDTVLGSLAPLAGSAWPAPFAQGTPVPDTLADVAAYYWTRDLRPTLKNDVPASSSKAPLDLDPKKDVAWWQHVNFSAISFGAQGTLDAGNQSTTLAGIVGGTLKWPDLTRPYDPIYPKGAGQGAVAVDDLWHATVMSRGSFVFARSPIEVSYGLAKILAGIQNQRKSRTGAAFGGQVLNKTNNVIFEPTIEPGWAGDLLKVEIDPRTGSEIKTWWQAAATLKDQIDPVKQGTKEPWMDPAHRRIVTLAGSSGPGIPFRWDSLTSAMKLSLAPDATTQQKMVSYLRGGNTWTNPLTSKVYTIEGTQIGQFRERFGVMGDISNAQPVIVFNPDRPYDDSTDPGYAQFKKDNASRPTRIVAPANDGMVHVFDAGPMPKDFDPPAVAPGGGEEVFAFIPHALFKGVAGTAAEDASGIQAMTYQDGGVPIYKHHMYVDSSPRTADIFDGSNWRTIVVGGLGKGGPSYYALDLTDASAGDETAAAAKVMWEWNGKDETGVQEVKYSYGRPVIVKVRDSAYPNGRWVVIVTGGYDNVSGKGKVFFLDAATGQPLSSVTTSAGGAPPAGDASGLAQIHAFVKDQRNQVAEQIYGGDLLGNVWRIDVSQTDQYKSATAELFAQLTDPGGAPQPVTVAPQIEIDISNGVDRYVFIGTGRLLDTSDLTTPYPPQTQTMYAIRDGTLKDFSTTGLPIQPRATMSPTNADGVSGIVGGAPNGWYHDLPNDYAGTGDSERIVVDPAADVNVASYVGTTIQNDPCVIALPAKLYARFYTTGESLAEDGGGNIIPYIDFEKGLVSISTVGMIQDDGTQIVGIIGMQEVPGAKPARISNKFAGIGNRLSWKLLGGE